MRSIKIKNMKIIVVVLATLILGVSPTLAQRTGTASESISKIDGERQVSVVPGWLKGKGLLSTSFLIGGFWSDRSSTNFIFQVVVCDSGTPEHLRISVDGHLSEFDAADASGNTWKSGDTVGIVGRFPATLAFVEQMVNAKNVVMDISTSSGTKQEGTFVGGGNMAKTGFKKGLEMIKK
jgi:hypothetical protein